MLLVKFMLVLVLVFFLIFLNIYIYSYRIGGKLSSEYYFLRESTVKKTPGTGLNERMSV